MRQMIVKLCRGGGGLNVRTFIKQSKMVSMGQNPLLLGDLHWHDGSLLYQNIIHVSCMDTCTCMYVSCWCNFELAYWVNIQSFLQLISEAWKPEETCSVNKRVPNHVNVGLIIYMIIMGNLFSGFRHVRRSVYSQGHFWVRALINMWTIFLMR